MSLVESDVSVPVKIHRDTGACGSYILSSVLPFSHKSETGDHFDARYGFSSVAGSTAKIDVKM